MSGPEALGVVFTTGTICATFLGGLWIWAHRPSVKGKSNALPPALDERMQRLEQSMESIAIEVERISEGQRFTTKLLTDRPEAVSVRPPDSTSR
jgi:hypothetical protein